MKIETKDNRIILKEVYSGITLQTRDGKELHICMRDYGFDIKINDGKFYHINDENDLIKKEL